MLKMQLPGQRSSPLTSAYLTSPHPASTGLPPSGDTAHTPVTQRCSELKKKKITWEENDPSFLTAAKRDIRSFKVHDRRLIPVVFRGLALRGGFSSVG